MSAIHSLTTAFKKVATRLSTFALSRLSIAETVSAGSDAAGRGVSIASIRAAQIARGDERQNRRARWWQGSLGS